MAATIRDEYRALETLLPHPRNYNVHSEKAVQSLADAMRVVAYTAPIICKEDGTVLGGHARRLALHKLRAESYPEPAGVQPGWQVPCRVVECNEAEELKILATDNPDPAQIDYDQGALAAILSDLQAKDSLEGTWYDAAALDALIGEIGQVPALGRDTVGSGAGVDPQAEWDGMPEYVHEDKTAYRTLHVHFADETAVEEFQRLIGQEFSPEARYIWHPKLEREDFMAFRYADED